MLRDFENKMIQGDCLVIMRQLPDRAFDLHDEYVQGQQDCKKKVPFDF